MLQQLCPEEAAAEMAVQGWQMTEHRGRLTEDRGHMAAVVACLGWVSVGLFYNTFGGK